MWGLLYYVVFTGCLLVVNFCKFRLYLFSLQYTNRNWFFFRSYIHAQVFDYFINHRHEQLRLNGYHEFYRATSVHKAIPLCIVSGNVWHCRTFLTKIVFFFVFRFRCGMRLSWQFRRWCNTITDQILDFIAFRSCYRRLFMSPCFHVSKLWYSLEFTDCISVREIALKILLFTFLSRALRVYFFLFSFCRLLTQSAYKLSNFS